MLDKDLSRDYSRFRIPGRPHQIAVRFVTYNVKEFVQQAIESVLAQVDVDLAIIVFDDASDDGTYEVLLSLESVNPDRIFVSRPVSNTFVSGRKELSILPLALVKADFIAFLDGDDYWTSNQKLARSLTPFDDANVSMVVHAISTTTSDKSRTSEDERWLNWNRLMQSNSRLARWVRRRLIAYPTNSIVMRYGSYPFKNYLEVNKSLTPDLLFKLFAKTKGSVVFLRESMAALRIRSESLWGPLSNFRQFSLTLIAAATALKMWGPLHGYRILRHAIIWSFFVFTMNFFSHRSSK